MHLNKKMHISTDNYNNMKNKMGEKSQDLWEGRKRYFIHPGVSLEAFSKRNI